MLCHNNLSAGTFSLSIPKSLTDANGTYQTSFISDFFQIQKGNSKFLEFEGYYSKYLQLKQVKSHLKITSEHVDIIQIYKNIHIDVDTFQNVRMNFQKSEYSQCIALHGIPCYQNLILGMI